MIRLAISAVWRWIAGPVVAFFNTPVGRAIAKAAAILGAAGLANKITRRDAAKDALAKDRAERAEDHIRRTDAGRAAAERAVAALRGGADPDDIVDGNDGAWGDK